MWDNLKHDIFAKLSYLAGNQWRGCDFKIAVRELMYRNLKASGLMLL